MLKTSTLKCLGFWTVCLAPAAMQALLGIGPWSQGWTFDFLVLKLLNMDQTVIVAFLLLHLTDWLSWAFSGSVIMWTSFLVTQSKYMCPVYLSAVAWLIYSHNIKVSLYKSMSMFYAKRSLLYMCNVFIWSTYNWFNHKTTLQDLQVLYNFSDERTNTQD